MGFLENIVSLREEWIRSLRALKSLGALKTLKTLKILKTLAQTVLHELVAELHTGIIEEFSYISLFTLFTYKKYISGIGNEEVFDILHYYQFILGKNHYVVAAVV